MAPHIAGSTMHRNKDSQLFRLIVWAMVFLIVSSSSQISPHFGCHKIVQGLSVKCHLTDPDPARVLQTPLHVEVNHQITLKARAGTLSIPNARKFNKIVYVGHSYGSVIGNSQNKKYPDEVDVTILTGINKLYNNAFIGTLAAGLAPANVVNPAKWSGLDSNYLTIANQSIFEQAYYYPGQFDQGLANLDFALRGTVGLGELESALAFPLVVATAYDNPILDITGQHDSLMCPVPDPFQLGKPWTTYDCGAGKNSNLLSTGALYPNAKYNYYTPPLSGHCVNFHLSAQSTFAYAHTWLISKGF